MKTKFLTWLLISVAFTSRAQQQMWLNPHPPGGTNASAPVTNDLNGLVLWLPLDETSGAIFQDVGLILELLSMLWL